MIIKPLIRNDTSSLVRLLWFFLKDHSVFISVCKISNKKNNNNNNNSCSAYLQEGRVLNKVHSRRLYANQHAVRRAAWEMTQKISFFKKNRFVDVRNMSKVLSIRQLELSVSSPLRCAAASLHSAAKEQQRQREEWPRLAASFAWGTTTEASVTKLFWVSLQYCIKDKTTF